jgi:2-C-methyl-D-erythritol 2,4-cyclodiphosphate synthase
VSLRVGLGVDTHRFADGRALVLGGVEIPHSRGLQGHSDADVLAHAVTDAILGAASMGDIGQHFPDTDPRFKDADSLALLREVVARVAAEGWSVEHVDATVVMERPKLAPHREAIAAALGAAVGGSVHVKATTGEGMGFVGREEGVAALAVATLSR